MNVYCVLDDNVSKEENQKGEDNKEGNEDDNDEDDLEGVVASNKYHRQTSEIWLDKSLLSELIQDHQGPGAPLNQRNNNHMESLRLVWLSALYEFISLAKMNMHSKGINVN